MAVWAFDILYRFWHSDLKQHRNTKYAIMEAVVFVMLKAKIMTSIDNKPREYPLSWLYLVIDLILGSISTFLGGLMAKDGLTSIMDDEGSAGIVLVFFGFAIGAYGIYSLLSFLWGFWRNPKFVIHDSGLQRHTRQDAKTWGWSDLLETKGDITIFWIQGLIPVAFGSRKFVKDGKTILSINGKFRKVDDLLETINFIAHTSVIANCFDAIKSGETILYDNFQLNQDGILFENKLIEWSDIQTLGAGDAPKKKKILIIQRKNEQPLTIIPASKPTTPHIISQLLERIRETSAEKPGLS